MDDLFDVFDEPKGGSAAPSSSGAAETGHKAVEEGHVRGREEDGDGDGDGDDGVPSPTKPRSTKRVRTHPPPAHLENPSDSGAATGTPSASAPPVSSSGGTDGGGGAGAGAGAGTSGSGDAVGADAKAKTKPAKEYPFKLDKFQQDAIGYVEANESVLVSAHTSAGKTVVAEYAIALCLRNKQRVIYTSPIKALSNQKYRDLYEEFSDVGLMTGDVTIAPNATCLVMTTEILRSMLYRGSEILREVAWVVFDEIHYMRDRERGVVWEESIIMLPHKVRFVFLSATIPNAPEFADWVAAIHKQPCHVVYTDYRPTPLQHFIYPAGAEGVFLVVDEKGKFRDDNFQKAMAVLGQTGLAEDVLGDLF